MWHTALFTLLSVPPLVLLPLGLALMVSRVRRLQWLFRLAFFAPFVLPVSVVVLVWNWMYQPGFGLINSYLTSLGFAEVNWLGQPGVAMVSAVIVTVWWTFGFNFVLYLAGLQEIPRELYEAAATDGATPGQQLRRITLPLLGSTIVLVTVLQVIASLKIFDQIYLLQLGTPGPENSTRPAIQYIYEAGFTQYRIGYASAMSFVFFLAVVAVTLISMRLIRRVGHEDGGDGMTSIVGSGAPGGLVEGPGRGGWARAVIYAVLVVLALIWVVPVAWAVATSLKPDAETTVAPVEWFGSKVTLEAYRAALEQGNILKWYFNSLVTATVITAGTILTASMAAFAFSRMRFRGRDALQWMVLAGLIVPFQALIVPLFAEMDAFGLADTYWGIILPQLASPIAVLVFKRGFDALPRELEESALVDGASMWRIYWHIWMPLSRATIAAVGIFTFVHAWNNFLWPFVVTSAGSLFTIPVGLATVQTSYGALYAQQMAIAVLGALPLLIAFVLFQRQIVQGIANTGLKG